jgi:hypothetical protein
MNTSVNAARCCDFLRQICEIIKIRLMILIRRSVLICTRFTWMGSFIYKLNRTRLLRYKKMRNLPLPTRWSLPYESKTTTDFFHTPPSPTSRSVLVTSGLPRWLTLACPKKRWTDKQSLVVPCKKPIIYFHQFCKVMWLRSEFRHVTQNLSVRTYENNWMCDITELVDFNLRTLRLAEDQLCTLNQTRLQDPSDYRLVQKSSAPWIECIALCVNTYQIKLPPWINNS